jgi:hypothetical protein
VVAAAGRARVGEEVVVGVGVAAAAGVAATARWRAWMIWLLAWRPCHLAGVAVGVGVGGAGWRCELETCRET